MDFSRVFATEKILEAVDHVLSVLSKNEKLCKKLHLWKNTSEGENSEGKGGYSSDYSYREGSIPFDLLAEVHQQLQRTPMGMSFKELCHFVECKLLQ